MNQKRAKTLRNAITSMGRNWREAEYTTDIHGSTVLTKSCPKKFYRQLKKQVGG